MQRPGFRTTGLILAWLSTAVTFVFAARVVTGLGDDGVRQFFSFDVYNAAMLLAALSCAVRAVTRREARGAWIAIATAGAAWSAGNFAYAASAGPDGSVPVPSLADPFWLMSPLALAAAIVLFARPLAPIRRRGVRLDAVLGITTVVAISAALVLESILGAATQLGAVGFAVNLAYPASDIAMVAAVVCVLVTRGWRLPLPLVLLATAILIQGVADSFYLLQVADGTYLGGNLLDLGWIVPSMLLAWAAWLPERTLGSRRASAALESAFPLVLGALSLTVMTVEALSDAEPLTIVCATVALFFAIGRMTLGMADSRTALRESRHEAMTDALTGLGNRRRLQADLDEWDGSPLSLTIFDLDGFKAYNDSYGHGAGDALLQRIGTALQASAAIRGGTAYRLGGDEFAAALPHDADATVVAEELAQAGDGFQVGASHGTALLPEDATNVEEALGLADARMYARKFSGRASAGRQSADVLLALLQERSPTLADHGATVAELATATAEALGMSDDEIQQVIHAASLHDIGKLALPEAIVNKPGPLDDEEWQFMRRHTAIGERILRAAPALAAVSPMVRSSHERWDGAGYPDRLAGTDIPLGARIIFVCDAYDAITEDRPYRLGRSPREALDELRRNAGTQFDPAVVDAFISVAERAADAGARRGLAYA